MKILRLKEYGTSQPIELSIDQIRSLRQFNGKIGIEPSNTANRYLLKANSWIGKFVIPGLTVDISPKIDLVSTLKMYLLGDGEANPTLVESLNRATKQDDFWDLVSELLINTVSLILKEGMKREYVEVENNSDFVRGQLCIVTDMIINIPVRTGTFCRYTELTPDIAQNQAILWGLETLGYLVAPESSQRIRFMTKRLAEVDFPSDVPVCNYKEETGNYRTALFLVSLIKSSLQTSSATFGLAGFGLMMDMNKVFEGYCRNQIRSCLIHSNLIVPDKISTAQYLCENVKLVPDFLIQSQEQILAVCDCKYKTDWRYQNSDVYQMLAYLEGYEGVEIAMIIHPESNCREVKVDKIDLPRSGRLYRVGLPVKRLMEPTLWSEVSAIIREILKKKTSKYLRSCEKITFTS